MTQKNLLLNVLCQTKILSCSNLFFQLEQMELEVKDLPPKDRQKYTTRVKSYKAELSKLQKDNVGQNHKELSFLTYMYLFCLVL